MKEKICPVCYILHKNPASDMCYKHYQQVKKYGKIMCRNSRTVFNMNEVRVFLDWCEIDTYDQFGNTTATFKFDKEFLPLIYKHKWQSVIKGNKIKSQYLVTTINKKRLYFHRIIMGNPINEIDHINRDSTDNRLCNLREANRSTQLFNTRKKEGISKYKGVYYSSTRNKLCKWHSELQINNKKYYSPWYLTEEEAIYARYIMEERFKVEVFQNKKVLETAIDKLSKEQKLSIEKCLLNKWKH